MNISDKINDSSFWSPTWEPISRILTSFEADNMLRRASTSDQIFPDSTGFETIGEFKSFGYYQVFAASNLVDTDLVPRQPLWIQEDTLDSEILSIHHACNPMFHRTIYVLNSQNHPNSSKLFLICWYKNECGVVYSGVPRNLSKDEYRAILEDDSKTRLLPRDSLPPLLMNKDIYNDYIYLLDGTLFTPYFDDGLSWSCRGKEVDVVTTTSSRKKYFKDTTHVLHVKENKHPHGTIFRKIFYLKDVNGNVVSPIGVQYKTFGTVCLDEIDIKHRQPRMDSTDKLKCKELLANRTVSQAYQESQDQQLPYNKRQLYNAARFCNKVVKTRYGPKPLDVFERDQASAFVPASNVEMVVRRGADGSTSKELISIFDNVLNLFLEQATTVAELENLRDQCKQVEQMSDRREQHDFISKHMLPKQDASGYLKSATVMMVDTTFGLNKTHVITVIVVSIRGYRSKVSNKPRLVPVSCMAHQQQSQDAHDRHVAAFQAVIDATIKRKPKFKNRRVTALITDGELALSAAYGKLSICESAQVLGCAYHKKKNLMYAKLLNEEQALLWGTSLNRIFCGGVLSALNRKQFESFLGLAQLRMSETSFNKVIDRCPDLYNRFSLINKLKGGICSQYATTNYIEGLNKDLKITFPGPVTVGVVTTKIREKAYEFLHEMTDAATGSSSLILCDNPISHWRKYTDEEKDKALEERSLISRMEPDVANLNSLFISNVGPHNLNQAVKDMRNNVYEIFDNKICVFVCAPPPLGKKAIVIRVNILREISNDVLNEISLTCDLNECRKSVKFCKHRVLALLTLTSEERAIAVQTYLRKETSADHQFRIEHTSKSGHKKGKRTFKPQSYANHARTVGEIRDRTFIDEGCDSSDLDSELSDEADENITVDCGISQVMPNPPHNRNKTCVLSLSDVEDCSFDPNDENDLTTYQDPSVPSPPQIKERLPRKKLPDFTGLIARKKKEIAEARKKKRKQQSKKPGSCAKAQRKPLSDSEFSDSFATGWDQDDYDCLPQASKYPVNSKKRAKPVEIYHPENDIGSSALPTRASTKPNANGITCNRKRQGKRNVAPPTRKARLSIKEETAAPLRQRIRVQVKTKSCTSSTVAKRRGRPRKLPVSTESKGHGKGATNVEAPNDESNIIPLPGSTLAHQHSLQSDASMWNNTIGRHMVSVNDSTDSAFYANDAFWTERNEQLKRGLELKLQLPLQPPRAAQLHKTTEDGVSVLEDIMSDTVLISPRSSPKVARRRGRPRKARISTDSKEPVKGSINVETRNEEAINSCLTESIGLRRTAEDKEHYLEQVLNGDDLISSSMQCFPTTSVEDSNRLPRIAAQKPQTTCEESSSLCPLDNSLLNQHSLQSDVSIWNNTIGRHMVSVNDSTDSAFYANDAFWSERNEQLKKGLELKLQLPLQPPKAAQSQEATEDAGSVLEEIICDDEPDEPEVAKRRGRPRKLPLSTELKEPVKSINPCIPETIGLRRTAEDEESLLEEFRSDDEQSISTENAQCIPILSVEDSRRLPRFAANKHKRSRPPIVKPQSSRRPKGKKWCYQPMLNRSKDK